MILIIFLTIKKLNKYVHKIFGILFVQKIRKKAIWVNKPNTWEEEKIEEKG